MTILFIVSLLILAVVFLVLRYIKTCSFILMVMLASFLIVGNGILPELLLKPLESPYSLEFQPQYSQKKNAIVILGTGVIKIPGTDIVKPSIMAYSRIYQGLQLYQACKKKWVSMQDYC